MEPQTEGAFEQYIQNDHEELPSDEVDHLNGDVSVADL